MLRVYPTLRQRYQEAENGLLLVFSYVLKQCQCGRRTWSVDRGSDPPTFVLVNTNNIACHFSGSASSTVTWNGANSMRTGVPASARTVGLFESSFQGLFKL